MEVYIVTYSQYNNYGSYLQNYALQNAIEKLGSTPYTVVFKDVRFNIESILKYILSVIPICQKGKYWINDRKKINKFKRKTKVVRLSYNQLEKIGTKEIIAIAGSDQIWNPDCIMKNPRYADLYFLRFSPKNKSFAYAPSFGVTEIPEELKVVYREYLKGFRILSVRESYGQKIIKDLIGIEVPIIADPIFLLSKYKWEEVAVENIKHICEKPYLLIYFLSKQNEALFTGILEYAKHMNLEVVQIAGNMYDKRQVIPTPEEFVKLISKAEFMVTDSFHGVAFSIIMNTSFVVLGRSDVKQISRVKNILQIYNLSERYCEEKVIDCYKIFTNISFDNVNEIMTIEKERAEKYLLDILKSNIEN